MIFIFGLKFIFGKDELLFGNLEIYFLDIVDLLVKQLFVEEFKYSFKKKN